MVPDKGSTYIETCLFGKQYLQVIALSVEDAVYIDLLVKTVKREIVVTDHEPVIGAQGID